MRMNATDAEALGRALALRPPGARYRFLFQPDGAGLAVQRVGGPLAGPRAAPAPAVPEGLVAGAMLVDARLRITFCLPADAARFLRALAAWCRGAIATVPPLACLIDSGAAEAAFDWRSDDAIRALDPSAGSVQRDAATWKDLVQADTARLASVLAACRPGERLWFWLGGPDDWADPPLVLQPVSSDPARDLFNLLVEASDRRRVSDVASGSGTLTEDGVLQLAGPQLSQGHLAALAEWTREAAAAEPALARLAGCRLARTERGLVSEIIADAALWEGLTRPPATATLAETAAILARLRGGESYWFWLTGSGPGDGFLTLAATADDPEGVAFAARVRGLYRRFDSSFADAVSGVAQVTHAGGLVLVSATPDTGAWAATIGRIAARLGPAGAVLVEAELTAGAPTAA